MNDEWRALQSWGFSEDFQEQWRRMDAQGVPGRVVADYGANLRVAVPDARQGTVMELARLSGRFQHQIQSREDWPHIGDFVAVIRDSQRAIIDRILPRKAALLRKNPGGTIEAQVMVANVDVVFILDSLNHALNPGRLERSLILVYESGAEPVVVLTKADLAEDLKRELRQAEAVAVGVPVLGVSAMTGEGLSALDPWMRSEKTIALMGPSGVGKSTLINRWLGASVQRVQMVRTGDQRGRHTTTHRELFRLPSGALVVDIPGIREVGLWNGETDLLYDDVKRWARDCFFTNCHHQGEPGCAVAQAIGDGNLSAERVIQFHKFERELAFMERKRSQRAESESRRRWKRRNQDAKVARHHKHGGH